MLWLQARKEVEFATEVTVSQQLRRQLEEYMQSTARQLAGRRCVFIAISDRSHSTRSLVCRLAFAVVSGVRSTAAQAMLQWRQAVQQGRREDHRRDFAASLLRVRSASASGIC